MKWHLCKCDQCGLKGRPRVGCDGSPYSDIMLIGEAPGIEETRRHRPFVGKSGKENDAYLKQASLGRYMCYVTNMNKCNPPDNRDPSQREMECCGSLLLDEIMTVRPRVIGALGRISANWLRGRDIPMEACHGRPFTFRHEDFECMVVPMFHPAYGLYRTEEMPKIAWDYRQLHEVYTGKMGEWKEDGEKREYEEIKGVSDLAGIIKYEVVPSGVVAIDTEWARSSPWCLSFSSRYGKAYVVMADQVTLTDMMARVVARPDMTVVMHNASYDIRVLRQMGIRPSKIEDTMVMAYLLQTEPQALKPLGYRHLGRTMTAYEDMVSPATRINAIAYLEKALAFDFPDPMPILEWKSGEPHVRHPQNVGKKIKGILRDVKKGADPWDRWQKIMKDGGGKEVEDVLGAMMKGDLSDIDRRDAVNYAGQDADVTIGIWPILRQAIISRGLMPTFESDMGAMPMVMDMEDNGMKISRPHFAAVKAEFRKKMDGIEDEISKIAGEHVNPGSIQQVASMLFNLKVYASRTMSTDVEHLKKVEGRHPVVSMVTDWRQYMKLETSYLDVLMRDADSNDRIHTTLKQTRVITGRLSSSDPNLMAQPVRTEEGRRIREGFIAEEGCCILCVDYSQIEMRVAAHESMDAKMVAIFNNKEDIHQNTAMDIFRLKEHEVDPIKHRYPAKRVGFGILTGITPEGLYNQFAREGVTGWTVNQCGDLIRAWFSVYCGVRDWIKDSIAESRRTGEVRDMFGRARLLPELKSAYKPTVEAGERYVVNGKVTMGAQGIIKRAMGALVPIIKGWTEDGYKFRSLIQVHDELVFEVSNDIAEIARMIVEDTMEGVVKLRVPVIAEGGLGPNWKEAK